MSLGLRQPGVLRLVANGIVVLWCLLAVFPLLWITVMSFKLPTDAFADNPLAVLVGVTTIERRGGWTVADALVVLLAVCFVWFAARYASATFTFKNVDEQRRKLMKPLSALIALGVALFIGPELAGWLESCATWLAEPVIGVTGEHYRDVWTEQGFFTHFKNSIVISASVVTLSLTIGTLAAYALARANMNWSFWLLVAALVFRALPHSVLAAGYLPVFLESAQYLQPLLGRSAPTLYGQPLAVIMVLVAINQPFTLWLLHAFFRQVPRDLDDAARVDGCTHFEAFLRVVLPVMWPGIVTAGLFSFLLAYNDYLITSLLLEGEAMTMIPAIASMFSRETTATDEVQAIAAAVSMTAPLFILVLVFQRRLVSGLTIGAIKG